MYLSDEKRKEKLTHHVGGDFIFESRVDLTGGVKVTYTGRTFSKEKLASAIATFIIWWTLSIRSELNGFSGMDCVQWEVVIEDCKRCEHWRDFFSDKEYTVYCPDCGKSILNE